MALDHFVSQVHLRNFYADDLGGKLMYAIRKSTGETFTPDSKSVCRIEEGNTTPYLVDSRAIEQFLKSVEPKYNLVIQRLLDGTLDHEAVFVVAGFTAYVMSCSPTGIRASSGLARGMVESLARKLDVAGKLPASPAALGGSSISELLRDGTLSVEIDAKYPQAVGINNILQTVAMFGNAEWELLQASGRDCFFTSDYPVAIEKSSDPRVLNRIVPLTPRLAVRIHPDISLSPEKCDSSFKHFRCRKRRTSHAEISAINRLLVRSAEDLIFSNHGQPWVRNFVRNNRGFRIETKVHELPAPTGELLLSQLRIVPIARSDW